jgi:peptide/nickel transport system ATP-binding protein
MKAGPLLEISGLHVLFAGDESRVTTAVQGVDLEIERGRTLGLVGESGSGKSVTALSVMRLLPKETAQVRGRMVFEGRELLSLSERAMQDLRGNRMAMIFQEPMTSLNPSYTVGDQIGEALERHRGMSGSDARRQAITLLERVRIPSAAARVDEYPHKLSGGMRQRVMIAMALACEPLLLIADEPTTALDVTIQAQILDLLRTLQTETGTAILLITHDLGVVAEMADDVAVMYAGEIVERGPVADVLAAPEHPYTVGLLGSIPRLEVQRSRLSTIKGMVPTLTAAFTGCRFAPRCPFVEDRCRNETQALRTMHTGGRLSRCWKAPLTELVA